MHRCLCSARVPRAGERVLSIADFPCNSSSRALPKCFAHAFCRASEHANEVLLQLLFTLLRVSIAVVAILVLLWWFGMRMPGKNVAKARPLSPDEVALREELRADVEKLAGEIGERNMWH